MSAYKDYALMGHLADSQFVNFLV